MARHLDWVALSGQSPLLGALPEPVRMRVRALTVERGGVLFRRGDKPHAKYVVIGGELRLVRQSRLGGEIVLQRTRQGFVAEASIDQPFYHCDAVAASPSEVLVIPRHTFADALRGDAFRKLWHAHLTRELRKVRAHAERLSLHTARERIIHFIETEGDGGTVALQQSKKDWAAELGLTHEALYRALSRMQAEGILRVDQQIVRLIE